MVLFGIKETDEDNHKRLTGVSLNPILKNLNMVNKLKIPFIVRLPIIPVLNDKEEHFCKVKSTIKNMSFCKSEDVMPYHILGAYKYELLQKEYLCSHIAEPDNEILTKWKQSILQQ